MENSCVKIDDIKEGLKIFKPNYHLNYGKLRISKIKNSGGNFSTLGALTKTIYTGGIFKRTFVDDIETGIPYISGQQLLNSNPLDSAKLISKKYTPRQDDMTLRENQILVSCAGTVGNIRLISKDLDGTIGSQDIIRVIPDESKSPLGFIYSYLSSPTAYNYIQSFIYGSVIPRIDATTLSKLPVPIFSTEKQEAIHKLITQSTELKVQANKMLEEIINQIESDYTFSSKKVYYSVNIKNVLQGDKFTKESRFEADFYQPQAEELIKEIKNREWTYLGDISNVIQRSGLRERIFVKVGIPLITGQNLNLDKLNDLKMLSRKFTKNIDKNITNEGDILISIQGTVGKIEYSFKNIYQGVFASDKLAKISIKGEIIHPGYIYAFLKSKIGQIQLQKHKTGSVIEWIIENNIASVVVPIPSDKGKAIGVLVEKLTLMRQEAYSYETTAIQLIETEIAQWQQ